MVTAKRIISLRKRYVGEQRELLIDRMVLNKKLRDITKELNMLDNIILEGGVE